MAPRIRFQLWCRLPACPIKKGSLEGCTTKDIDLVNMNEFLHTHNHLIQTMVGIRIQHPHFEYAPNKTIESNMKHHIITRNEQERDIKTPKESIKPLTLPEFNLADGLVRDVLERKNK